MGSDLQLTGLASGFDWAPVVEQLIELERIPQRRLEQEKFKMKEKLSDLDVLKSQLDTLNGASKALQDENLFKARKVGFSDSNSSSADVTAEADSLTGEFSIKVESKSSITEMSSKNRVLGGLGSALGIADDTFDPSLKLEDLPIQTAITKGTFTIAGKTFSINNLGSTLQDV